MKKALCLSILMIFALSSLPTAAQDGPRRGVFAKIGDSNTVHPAGLAALANGFDSAEEYAYLRTAWDYWQLEYPSFNADSTAATDSWKSIRFVSEGFFNQHGGACQPHETAVACEYRLVRPSVALIMVGTNDVLEDAPDDEFETNLRQILEISETYGVYPVLSTIPPMWDNDAHNQRVLEINAIIKRVGQSYGAYIWDLWGELQPIWGQGIGADGIHLSIPPDGNTTHFGPEALEFGHTWRNLSALKVLDHLRRRGY